MRWLELAKRHVFGNQIFLLNIEEIYEKLENMTVVSFSKDMLLLLVRRLRISLQIQVSEGLAFTSSTFIFKGRSFFKQKRK